MTGSSFGVSMRPGSKSGSADAQRTMMQLSDNFANLPQIKSLVDGNSELLKELRMPNPKKRLQAIVDLKKLI